MEDTQIQLIKEQFARLRDNIEARFQKIERDLNHQKEISTEKRSQTISRLTDIRDLLKDHEDRIRQVDDAVITQRTTGSLLQAGQAGLSLLLSSIAAWLGTKQ